MFQIISSVIRRCFKRKREPESEDQNEPRKVLVVEGANDDVQSNSIPRSTSSSSQSGWDHDVFLSFRGEDTRKNFTDHLYSALVQVGIRTFRDDEGLDRGEIISSELLNAIRRSRISIVVFSKGYASSRWCLDELTEIVNCKNTIGHTLLPVFYDVDPTDVRKQTKTFAEAFKKWFQTDMGSVQRWREALTQAANCAGWNLANKYESQVIEKIVKEVLCKVDRPHLDVAIHPVGLQSRVEHIKALLNLKTDDFRIVGFYGMGGIGKTTLAKAVFNEICRGFQGCSFLFNVKIKSKESEGLVHLQEQLLYDILGKGNWNVSNVSIGITLIKERIRGKKVLLVLDDVDHLDQLHALAGLNFKLFGPGSRLIATTRDEQLLDLLKVNEKYKVNELNHWESLQLFRLHAFQMTDQIKEPPELSVLQLFRLHAFQMTDQIKEPLELSVRVVKYIGGLPLALVVLGSSLLGKSVSEWESKLEKLQKISAGEIHEKLKVSFDSLEDDIKEIFLDIACFFIGMGKEYVMKILLACDLYAEYGLGILIQRSLVTVEDNKLKMHDLIRDMGRGIVYAESPRNPGRRSRLWFHEDIANVLRSNTGSEIVKGLILNHHVLEGVSWETEAFKNMKNLRLLQINNVHLSGSYEHLPKGLKWLCWHKCPLKFLPQDFLLEDLVILDMQDSNLKQVWKMKKHFNELKILNLSNSKYLSTSPDFSQVPKLETLILEGCTSLVQVHESVGHLKSLVLLNLTNCTNLKYLPISPEQSPSSFGLFLNLKVASFSRCRSLTELPNFSHVPHLESLKLNGCISLVKIHESVGFLKRLVLLNLEGCVELMNLPSSISNLESLETLNLLNCYKIKELPEQLGNLTALKTLDVRFTAIKQLPTSFNLLENLEDLSFHGCKRLTESPEFSHVSHFKDLSLDGCISLVKIHESVGFLKRLVLLNLEGCVELMNLPSSIFNLESLETLKLLNCYKIKELPEQLGNLTALKTLDVGFTAIKQLPTSFKLLENLENLSFHGCKRLIESPEFVETSHLKNLRFHGCNSLEKIHESIGHLKRLESLKLSECQKFVKLPKLWGNMKALLELDAYGTAIGQLPSSLGELSNLNYHSSNCKSLLPIFEIKILRELDLSGNNLSEDDFPSEFGCLYSLKSLKLSRNNFCNLPSCISGLLNLDSLDLTACTSLQSISLNLDGIIALWANDCTSLERISIMTDERSGSSYFRMPKSGMSFFFLNNCPKLVEIQNLERLQSVPAKVEMGCCKNLSSEFREIVLQMIRKTRRFSIVFFPGSEIPNGIRYQAMGSSVSFHVPSFLHNETRSVVFYVVYAIKKEAPIGKHLWFEYVCFRWRLRNKSSRDQFNEWNILGHRVQLRSARFNIFEDHIYAQVSRTSYFSEIRTMKKCTGDEIEVAIFSWDENELPPYLEVKRFGIHFIG